MCRELRCRWDAAHGTGTTSYTGIAEVAAGVVLLAYDKTSGAGRSGDLQKVYSVRIELTSAEDADTNADTNVGVNSVGAGGQHVAH
jgi:hypothetical protein